MVKGINPPGELRGLTLWGVKGVIPPGRGVKGVNPPGGLRGLTSQGGCTYDYITLLSLQLGMVRRRTQADLAALSTGSRSSAGAQSQTNRDAES